MTITASTASLNMGVRTAFPSAYPGSPPALALASSQRSEVFVHSFRQSHRGAVARRVVGPQVLNIEPLHPRLGASEREAEVRSVFVT